MIGRDFFTRQGLPPTYRFDLHMLSVRGLLDSTIDFSAVHFPIRREFGSVVSRDPAGRRRVEVFGSESDR